MTSHTRYLRAVAWLLAMFSTAPALGQSFNSGSTGADGALDLSSIPSGTTVTFNPASYQPRLDPEEDLVFHFTTITIPSGVTLKLSARYLPGPVYFLARGDVAISGTIDATGENGPPYTGTNIAVGPVSERRVSIPGPGGFFGGAYAANTRTAMAGGGPGGGAGADWSGCGNCSGGSGAAPGTFTGNQYLVPLIGGSGGGGGRPCGAGGAGGGAIMIASSTSITVTGTITVNGGAAGYCANSIGAAFQSAAGAGGAIRLIAPTIQGGGALRAIGGASNAGSGVIRLESFQPGFIGTAQPGYLNRTPFRTYVPSTPPPTIRIIGIDNMSVPRLPLGDFAAPDVSITAPTAVTLTLEARQIPLGTVVNLYAFSEDGADQLIPTSALEGATQALSQAQAQITLPTGHSRLFLWAVW